MSKNQTVETASVNPVMQAIDPHYKHHKVVPMILQHEGQELYLPMVLLTGREENLVETSCYNDTLLMFKGRPPKKDEDDEKWKTILDVQRAYWIILQSVRTPNDLNKQWFINKEQVEVTYNWDEAGIIASHYLELRRTQPCFKNIDMSDPLAYQKMIDQIKKHGEDSAFFLNSYTTASVNSLIRFLVSDRENYLKSSGSSGAP